eukprot:CAMPEP_0197652158 /NCGR_PEP_ID=MMETSP1338-20131121/34280_1 /TAXON_ID=43686 ORGANISM="Pelagodinium beii, Strain RCC1491" /NCGR_SAMPLE_ID=MMETSP1338 /ASSEMBLY_ACC=CAM_ASM_000754 /LENGTH=93 /DNA_ID=CAMNT_0043226969 /DNA_START=93 /DNA_END=371 /DNA_ORIENTATION=+
MTILDSPQSHGLSPSRQPNFSDSVLATQCYEDTQTDWLQPQSPRETDTLEPAAEALDASVTLRYEDEDDEIPQAQTSSNPFPCTQAYADDIMD